ncbi:hypothetical protein D0817_24465 [Flavobacterium cupreum]|uniref:Uncharacterized protein n=1 Tax=Flavobacterium cupreum TaxID=2133766 RepID=A0A434A099_9FLAO|nr:hypothetical protein [Flavobacterium cupreum]RUT67810.1 hypothetical protein D0817_24465 [Flavobacterium cupreum]
MKKNKMSFETSFWSAYEIGNPFEVVDAFFDYAHLDSYKHTLGDVVSYANKGEVYKKDYPGEVFVFYTAMHSFIKACYCLQSKSRKWKIKETSDCRSVLHQASLTAKEYADPFAVFKKAFAEKSLGEFEFFLCEITHLSLSPHTVESDGDLTTAYIYLVKMMDAGQLMRERGLEKIKKDDCLNDSNPVTQ